MLIVVEEQNDFFGYLCKEIVSLNDTKHVAAVEAEHVLHSLVVEMILQITRRAQKVKGIES